MTTRSTPTAATLANLYRVIKENIRDREYFYTEDEIEKLKQDKNNNFIRENKTC